MKDKWFSVSYYILYVLIEILLELIFMQIAVQSAEIKSNSPSIFSIFIF